MPIHYRALRRLCVYSCGTLAGLAGSGVTHAQSSVTLYGIVDAGLVYTSSTRNSTGTSGGSQWLMSDSGLTASRVGLKGSEDLGNGLTAGFNLESGIHVGNGGLNNSNGNLFGREAWVSLASRWGEIKGGLQYSPFFWAIVGSDARNFSQFGSGLVTYADAVLGTSIFTANAVGYTSPAWAGFTGSVMIALGGQAGDFQAGRQYSASLTYANGPLSLDAAFFDGNEGGTVQTATPTTLSFIGRTVGGSYRWGTLTVKASATNFHVAGSFNSYVYSAGLDSSVLPDLNLNAGVWITRDRNASNNRSVMAAVGAEYAVSKRTTLYSQIGFVNNRGAMNTGLSVSALSTLYGASGSTVGANVGIRQVF
jgi:predicted porin